jgi:hypothetical protein
MPQTRNSGEARRAPRVKLSGTVLALVRLQNGRQIRASLHQLSFTGGLLLLESPLDEGIKAELMFHVGGSTIRGTVAMRFPMWATQGCLQPFEFNELSESDRLKLKADLEKFLSAPSSASTLEDQASSAAAGE